MPAVARYAAAVSSSAPDFAILGGGVIGCGIARALARQQAGRIVVVERGQPGCEASGAAAGVLAVASSRAPRGVVFDLKRASAALFPGLATELREETGIDVEYSTAGLLDLAFTSREVEQLDRLAARRREQGFAVERLEADEVRARHPEVNPAVRRGVWFGDDRAVNNTRLVEALHASAAARGVEFRLGVAVRRIESRHGRVTAVEAGAERLTPGHLIVAAGAWSAEVGQLLGVKIPVRADRGEMVAVRPRVPLALTHSWRDGYLVPRANGEVLIGSTSARGATEKMVTAHAAATLLSRAVRMVPALADAAVVRTWAGLRPLSALRRPIIGPPRGWANLTLACGHHRSGILLAPVTAQLVAELLLHGATSIPIGPFCHRPR
jgi:glycine oxidase